MDDQEKKDEITILAFLAAIVLSTRPLDRAGECVDAAQTILRLAKEAVDK